MITSNFSQGVLQGKDFLVYDKLTNSINISSPFQLAIADRHVHYLHRELNKINSAWTLPKLVSQPLHLYVDISVLDGKRTFGHSLVKPTYSPSPPSTSGDWFDTTINQFFKFDNSSNTWIRVLRVYVATLNTNYSIMYVPVGIGQAGLASNLVPFSIELIVYDIEGKAVINEYDEFITERNKDLVRGNFGNKLSVNATVHTAIAGEAIAKNKFVKVDLDNITTVAQYDDISSNLVLLNLSDVQSGDMCTLMHRGIVTNDGWDFSAFNVGDNLWIDLNGDPTATNPFFSEVSVTVNHIPIGRVINDHTILFDQGFYITKHTHHASDFILSPPYNGEGDLDVALQNLTPTDGVSLSGDNVIGDVFLDYSSSDILSAVTKQQVEGRTLNDLTDVTITSPSNDDVVKYDGSAWVNGVRTAGNAITSGYIIEYVNNQLLDGAPYVINANDNIQTYILVSDAEAIDLEDPAIDDPILLNISLTNFDDDRTYYFEIVMQYNVGESTLRHVELSFDQVVFWRTGLAPSALPYEGAVRLFVNVIPKNNAVDVPRFNINWVKYYAIPETPVEPGVDTFNELILSHEPSVYYRMDETSGTVAFDSSGNDYHGTYVGNYTLNAPATVSDSTGAVIYDGIDAHIQGPDTPNLAFGTGELTTMIIVDTQRIGSQDSNNIGLFVHGQEGPLETLADGVTYSSHLTIHSYPTYQYDMMVENEFGVFRQIYTENMGIPVEPLNSPTLLVYVRNNDGVIDVYYNGVHRTSIAAVAPNPNGLTLTTGTNGRLQVGKGINGHGFFRGTMSHFAAFPAAMTASDVEQLYNLFSDGKYPLFHDAKYDYPVTNSSFGRSLALSGDHNVLAVGANTYDAGYPNAGAVIVYDAVDGDWVQRDLVTYELTNSIENIGEAVALNSDGTVLVITCPRRIVGGVSSVGSVLIFTWDGTSYNFSEEIQETFGTGSTNSAEYFGTGVALTGDGQTMFVGSRTYNLTGTVYVLKKISNVWTLDSLIPPVRVGNFSFGTSVSIIDSTHIMISDLNYLYLYELDGTTWDLVATIESPDRDWAIGSTYDYVIINAATSPDGSVLGIMTTTPRFSTGPLGCVAIYDRVGPNDYVYRRKYYSPGLREFLQSTTGIQGGIVFKDNNTIIVGGFQNNYFVDIDIETHRDGELYLHLIGDEGSPGSSTILSTVPPAVAPDSNLTTVYATDPFHGTPAIFAAGSSYIDYNLHAHRLGSFTVEFKVRLDAVIPGGKLVPVFQFNNGLFNTSTTDGLVGYITGSGTGGSSAYNFHISRRISNDFTTAPYPSTSSPLGAGFDVTQEYAQIYIMYEAHSDTFTLSVDGAPLSTFTLPEGKNLQYRTRLRFGDGTYATTAKQSQNVYMKDIRVTRGVEKYHSQSIEPEQPS